MDTPADVSGGFASNHNNSPIRDSEPLGAELENVCTWHGDKSQVTERNMIRGPLGRGQLSGRKLKEPPAPECSVPAHECCLTNWIILPSVILSLIRMEPVLIEPLKSQHNQFPYGNEIQIPSFCVFELGLEFWHVISNWV